MAQNEKKEVIILPSSNANEEIISELAKGNNVRLVDGEYTINNSIILNDYSISKALVVTVLSLIAIVVLWAVLILLYALTVQMFSLVFNLIKEIQYKVR